MNWRDALQKLAGNNTPHVLVTIVDVRGSAPRAVGTKMVVTADAVYDTVGGGGFEHQLVGHCRRCLCGEPHESPDSEMVTLEINLARDAAQCCGGVVKVLLECFRPAYAPVVLCGAGHVGSAIVRILSQMQVSLTVLDSRPDWLAHAREVSLRGDSQPAATLETVVLTQPHVQIEHCAKGAVFLVMTHSHDLDFELCEAILSRPDAHWCGLIASDSKAASFNRRLSAKGFSAQELLPLVAPVGLPGVVGKEPMAVAVSVVAQLLSLPAFSRPAIKQENRPQSTSSAAPASLS